MKLKQYFAKYESKLELILDRKPTKIEWVWYAFRGIKDFLIYGSTITDYFELGFYQMKHAEKKTYYTQRFASKFDFDLDSVDSINEHNSKVLEYKLLKKYFKRDQLVSNECTFEEFREFCQKHPVFFFKPDEECCGYGIEKLRADEGNMQELYEKVRKIKAVLDEPVIQHPEMERLCPGSINTVRVISAKVDGRIHIIGTAIRMGNGSNVVDNYALGGFGAALDQKTGIIIDRGIDHSNKRYERHPFSNVIFKGFQVPHWDQVLHLVNEAHMAYDLNYCGWDVAVRENDCLIIEVNPRPMIELIQLAGNGGKKAAYQEVYDLWKKTDGRKK